MSEVPLPGPRRVLGGWAFSYERGTPISRKASRPLGPADQRVLITAVIKCYSVPGVLPPRLECVLMCLARDLESSSCA